MRSSAPATPRRRFPPVPARRRRRGSSSSGVCFVSMPAKSKPSQAPAYLLQGQDDRLKRRALEELLDRLVDPAGRDFDLEQLDVDSASAEDILAALASLPLFSDRRVGVLPNPGRLRHTRHRGTQERLAAVLPGPGRRLCPILVACA